MSAAAAPPAREMSPYKGPVPFETKDLRLFFGRDAETADLCAMIEDSVVSVLYASSGAGKSSLLRARAIPALEDFWRPVAIFRPKGQPLRAMTASALAALLPPPRAELAAVDRLIAFSGDAGGGTTLFSARESYTALRANAPQSRDLIAPVSIEDLGDPLSGHFSVEGADTAITPIIARCLFSAEWESILLRTLTMLERGCELKLRAPGLDGPLRKQSPMRARRALGELPLSTLRAALADEAVNKAYEERAQALFGQHAESPAAFLESLAEGFTDGEEPLRLVFVGDQFEQLFTMVDARSRKAFAEGLRELLATRGGGYSVRLLISLRDDYVAHLDRLEPYLGNLSPPARYGLGLLAGPAFRDAVVEPARKFAYGYDKAALDILTRDLLNEEEYAEPGPLQIVCDRLWNDYGRELSSQGAESGGRQRPEITADDIERIGGVKKILAAHFRNFIAPFSEQDQLEILDLLSLLRTSDGVSQVRNIVTRKSLEGRPPRNAPKRSELLGKLRDARIIRFETHRMGELVEIIHELLLPEIGDQIDRFRQSNPRWELIQIGLERLASNFSRPFDGTRVLSDAECEALCWFREHIDADAYGERFALRMIYEIVMLEAPIDTPERRRERWKDHLAYWAAKTRTTGQRRFSEMNDIAKLDMRGGVLWPEEVHTILDCWSAGELNEPALRVLVRSAIHFSSPEETKACIAKLAPSATASREGVTDGGI